MAHSFLVSELTDPVIELASDHSGNLVSQPVEQTARDWRGQIGGEANVGAVPEAASQLSRSLQPGLVPSSGRSVPTNTASAWAAADSEAFPRHRRPRLPVSERADRCALPRRNRLIPVRLSATRPGRDIDARVR